LYKETSRLYRRTVFTEQDWIRFRSSGRLFDNLATMFTSGVIRGLWLEIGSVSLVSTVVFLLNTAILSGALEPTVPASESYMLALPSLPFQLSSPALGLLLVFRTNTVYSRWNQVLALSLPPSPHLAH
jgi:ion channel-forming bestrophin family protein